jgi:hypothetical protein
MSKTKIHHYEGPGIYYIGKHGINITEDLNGLVKSLRRLADYYDDDFELGYDTGEGSTVYIEELNGEQVENQFEAIYKVVKCSPGEEIHFQMLEASLEIPYYGTDHSIFGSGNVEIRTKGKVTFKWE